MEGRRASATTTSPVAFGEDPQLLGMLTVPEPGAAVHRRGVVICAPFGHEHTRAFRPLRTLAERIAESGWPVLRFDWPSSGDSGDAAPGSRVDMRAWTLSVQQAIDTLRERTKVDVVTIVGLRIGASIGLLAGTAEPTVSEIVLLAPFTTGRAYLDAMRAYDVATGHLFSEPAGPVPPVPEGAIEASGFLMSAGEVRALESLDLASWRHALHAGGRPPVGEILLGGALELLARGGRTSHEGRILEALDRLGARNTSALLVLSGGDRGIGYFERHIGLDYRPVLERHGVTTEIIRGPDHTFRPLWSHEALRRVLEAQLHRIEFLEIDEASNVERRSGVGRDRA